MWDCCPTALLDYSSRLEFGRRESRTSRRFAPGLWKSRQGWRSYKELLARMRCARATKLDVVKAQGYFA